jgi:hypothetical protein
MIATLKSIVSCDMLSLEKSFKGTCFGHAFFKMCQYATIDTKVHKGFRYISIKVTHGYLQKCII